MDNQLDYRSQIGALVVECSALTLQIAAIRGIDNRLLTDAETLDLVRIEHRLGHTRAQVSILENRLKKQEEGK